MIDVAVIGAGPSGISSAIYAKRAGLEVKVYNYGNSQLEKAHKIDNYYGFEDGISGKDLFDKGIKQAKNLGIDVIETEIVDITIQENPNNKECYSFNLYDKNGIVEESKSLIIATGNKKKSIDIDGISQFEGKGVSYCAICDGYFYRGKNVAVIGDGDFALNEANTLEGIASNITILTNGNNSIVSNKKIDARKIAKILGNSKVTGVQFEDGEIINLDGVFVAVGVAGGIDFARKIGIAIKDNQIVVDDKMQTNIKGLYCVGDIIGGLLQVNKSVYEGAVAGLSASNFIKENWK